MNPNDPIVQTIARTLAQQILVGDYVEDEPLPRLVVELAMNVLFDLAKTGVKLVHPDDVIESEPDTEAHTVKLLLRAE